MEQSSLSLLFVLERVLQPVWSSLSSRDLFYLLLTFFETILLPFVFTVTAQFSFAFSSQGPITGLIYETHTLPMGIHLLYILSLKLFLRSKGQILLFSVEWKSVLDIVSLAQLRMTGSAFKFGVIYLKKKKNKSSNLALVAAMALCCESI